MALRSFLEGALFAEMYGDGDPSILALHGWGRRGSDFAAVLEGLSGIAPDLPGFGASPAPDEAIGAEAYADIVAGMLDFFDRPPVLVGHSFGGRVAVCLAAKHPDRVGAMVLSGVPLIRLEICRRPPFAYRVVRRLNRIGLISNERLEREKRSRGSDDYRATSGVMRDILVKVVNESYEGQLGRLQSHVHLLWGADDGDVPVSVAETADALIPDSTLEVLPGVGHMVPLQAPEALRQAIEKASS
ncbi:MAG TPA: alpha/beta hydrolase [Acidimicrobiia bacterium]|nr:alpha/beta hydrolase [Acidimicrobiia bacterium]